WRGRCRHGAGQYFMGTSLAYMSASALYRMARPPAVIGGLAMWWGFVAAMLKRAPRYDDPEFRTFLRAYQFSSLWRGKRNATRLLDQRQESQWDASRSMQTEATLLTM